MASDPRPGPSPAIPGSGSAELPTLAEELFALRFELIALANSALAGKSERWVDGFVPETTAYAHRRRYELAASRAAGRRVLDLSCGAGAGSRAMAVAGATSVLGVDIDPDAIRYARHRHSHERCRFVQGDAETWSSDSRFDLIVSFETIEHLEKPETLLATIERVLAPGGECLISTPVASEAGSRPTNPYHLQEWTRQEFVTMLRTAGFSIADTWYQGVRPHGGLAGRARRGLARLLSSGREGTALAHGEGLLESADFYRRSGLRPKFQVHLVHQADAS